MKIIPLSEETNLAEKAVSRLPLHRRRRRAAAWMRHIAAVHEHCTQPFNITAALRECTNWEKNACTHRVYAPVHRLLKMPREFFIVTAQQCHTTMAHETIWYMDLPLYKVKCHMKLFHPLSASEKTLNRCIVSVRATNYFLEPSVSTSRVITASGQGTCKLHSSTHKWCTRDSGSSVCLFTR